MRMINAPFQYSTNQAAADCSCFTNGVCGCSGDAN